MRKSFTCAPLCQHKYERLMEEVEMLRDVRAYDEAKKAIAEGEELIPSEVTYAVLDGLNPVRVWREHRGLTKHFYWARKVL